MKGCGWGLLIFGIICVILVIVALASGGDDSGRGANSLGVAIGLLVLGAYLIHRGKQKDQEKKEMDEWKNGGKEA